MWMVWLLWGDSAGCIGELPRPTRISPYLMTLFNAISGCFFPSLLSSGTHGCPVSHPTRFSLSSASRVPSGSAALTQTLHPELFYTGGCSYTLQNPILRVFIMQNSCEIAWHPPDKALGWGCSLQPPLMTGGSVALRAAVAFISLVSALVPST